MTIAPTRSERRTAMAKRTAQRAQTQATQGGQKIANKLPQKDKDKKTPPKKVQPPPPDGSVPGVKGNLGCQMEFTVVGRGEGADKEAALKAAHADAADTAKLECKNRKMCNMPVLIKAAKADATRPVNGKSTAVVEDVYKCSA
jgi:hypothetical protein